MTTDSDRHLIHQIRTGTKAVSDAAWKELYDRYVGRVRAYIRRRLMTASLVDDAVQETFIGFQGSLPNYDDKRDLQSWLFSIACYKVIDALRRETRQPFPSDGEGPDETLAAEPDARQRAASSLYRSKEQRDNEAAVLARELRKYLGELQQAKDYPRLMVLELLFVKQMKNQHVAAELKLPDQTIANYKFQAVKRLSAAVRAASLPADAFPELDDATNPDPGPAA